MNSPQILFTVRGYSVTLRADGSFGITDPAGAEVLKEGAPGSFTDLTKCEEWLSGVISEKEIKAKLEAGKSYSYSSVTSIMDEVHSEFVKYKLSQGL